MTVTATLATSPVGTIPLPARRTWRSIERLGTPDVATQGSLALSYPLSDAVGADPAPRALVVVPHGTTADGSIDSWAATFLQAVVEVVASDRPLAQLLRWTSRPVYAEIAERQQQVARHRQPARVRASRQHVATVHVSRITGDHAEVAARVRFGTRSRAIAARLDHVRGRWVCTAISFG